jgi:hypothetical protein
LPNRITKIAKLNWIAVGNRICQTKFHLLNRTAKLIWNTKSLNLPLTLPKWIPFLASIACRTELPNRITKIAKLNCRREQNLPNQISFAKPNCQIDLEYRIIESAFNSA